MYEKGCLMIQYVLKWKREFEAGQTVVDNLPQSGQLSDRTSTFENVQQVHYLLTEDRHMTITELWLQLQSPNCSCVLDGRIIHNICSY